jgi:lipoprotein NlpD
MNYANVTKALGAASLFTLGGCGILDTIEVPMPDVRFDSQTYVVQPGDTLESVASRYHLDPNVLMQVNDLDSDLLTPRQVLLLDRGSRATIARGDSDYYRGRAIEPYQPATEASVDDTVAGDALLDDPQFVSESKVAPILDQQGREVTQLPPAEPIASQLADAMPASPERPEGEETIIAEVRADFPTQGVKISDSIPDSAKNLAQVKTDSKWNWPTVGKIVREFDLAEINRQGVDIDAGPGAGVQAAADGEVVYSGKDLASYGNLVILRHDDNYLTAYSKVNDIIVKENQKVRAGDVIAILGSDQAQGTELHFEIRHNGEPVNPVDYLPAL